MMEKFGNSIWMHSSKFCCWTCWAVGISVFSDFRHICVEALGVLSLQPFYPVFRSTSKLWKSTWYYGWQISVRFVRPYVRLSTKSFFNFDEIWYTRKYSMRDEKVNDHARIQGQGQEPMKVGNSTILDHFQTISSPIYNGGWQVITDS